MCVYYLQCEMKSSSKRFMKVALLLASTLRNFFMVPSVHLCPSLLYILRSIVNSSGDLSKDSIFRVRDPLACRPLSSSSSSSNGRGGKTEAEGIKMACPSRDVRTVCRLTSHISIVSIMVDHGCTQHVHVQFLGDRLPVGHHRGK